MSRAVFSTADASLMRQRAWPVVLWAIASLLGIGGCFLLPRTDVAVAAVMAASLAGIIWALLPRRSAEPLEASPAGLRLGHELLRARADILKAEIVDATKPSVLLHCRSGVPLRIDVVRRELGEALVSALALDAAQRAVRFELLRTSRAPLVAAGITILMTCAVMLATKVPYELVTMLPVFALGALISAYSHHRTARRLSVGPDGALLEEGSRKRWLRRDEVASLETWVRPKPGISGLTLTLSDGASIDVPIEPLPLRGSMELPGQKTLAIAALFEAAPPEDDHEPFAAELARGDATPAAWLARLLDLGRKTGYRRGALGTDRLYRIVHTPSEEPSIRLGAAVLLSRLPEAEHKDALRIAADTITEPELRAAIDELAEAEDEAARLSVLTDRFL